MAAVLAFVPGRGVSLTGCLGTIATGATAIGVAVEVWTLGAGRHEIGGWGAPLGIDLVADGASALLLAVNGTVGVAVAVYALAYLRPHPPAASAARALDGARAFWPLWLVLLAALNALVLSADLFNLFVALEITTLAAVALVTLHGEPVALVAGMRYLLASVFGSLAYLMGVAVLYAAHGVLDLELIGSTLRPSPDASIAVALVTIGLLIKAAVVPLHTWLPAAHANAPAPVSAALSGLVVTASVFVLLRIWVTAFAAARTPLADDLLGALGMTAVLWGSLLAVRQERLKMLVAYSTVAQVGYFLVLIPLLGDVAGGLAWAGGLYHALSHACAKAALFLAAGNVERALGHDRIDELAGAGARLPLTFFAFALGGVSLMGLPPSGGFVAKWLLLSAALEAGRWGPVLVLTAGSLTACAYVFRPLARALAGRTGTAAAPVPRAMELAALALALLALVLGLASAGPLALLEVGTPVAVGVGPPGPGPS